MNERKKAKRKPKKKSMLKRLLKLFTLLGFVAFFSAIVLTNYRSIVSLDAQLNGINDQIAKGEEEKLALDRDQAYYESDEFIEKIAREQLGLIKRDEIIFIQK